MKFYYYKNTLITFTISILTSFYQISSAFSIENADENLEILNIINEEEDLKKKDHNIKMNELDNSENNKNNISNKGIFYENANIIVLNKNLAETTMLSLAKGQSVEFDNLIITLQSCWQESNNVYDRENKALIEIADKDTKKIVFNKWIFSKYKNLTNTFYKKYLFSLEKCN